MSLSVGIVGLPNVGKSTLFNALLKKQVAYVANFPFATIEPNVGVVPVPDKRLNKLAEIYQAPIVPATVSFTDIAGLIKGASKGEGLGNKFLSHIRETDAILHVVRAFTNPDIIKQGITDPKTDFETVSLELELADLEMIERQKKKKHSDSEVLPLFKNKPTLIALNIDEQELKNSAEWEKRWAEELRVDQDQVVAICAKIEAELTELPEAEQKEYLKELGVEESGLEKLIQKAFKTLGLMTFLTAGEKEARAWTIRTGTTAVEASGVIHTDFRKNFIAADVVKYDDFIAVGGWKKARELGKVRLEGRDYIVQEGDVVEFKIGS